VLGGFQVGANKQFGTFVLGLETDFDLTSFKNTTEIKLPWFGATSGASASWLIPPGPAAPPTDA